MEKLKIMISNDDGVKNAGIDALAKASKELGEIFIVAPDRQQTARSKALTFHRPIRVNKTTTISGIPALSHDAPPAVSVIVHESFYDNADLVLSGINAGDNASLHSILTSGTCAVAMEAGMKGIPAIAFSLDVPDEFFFGTEIPGELVIAAQLSAIIAKVFYEASEEFWSNINFLNVNFPKTLNNETAVEFAELESYKYINYLRERKDPSGRTYYWLWGDKRTDFNEDADAYKVYIKNVATITPVSFSGIDMNDGIYAETKTLVTKVNELFKPKNL